MEKHKVNGVVCAYSGSYRKSGFYDTAMVLATVTSIQKTSKEKPHDPQGTCGKNKIVI
jgi:hypothetical protein